MQLSAKDADGLTIFADEAEKQRDYRCHECGGAIRLRRGTHRIAHFYHLHTPEECRQSGKSLTHLQIQKYIYQTLQPLICFLEHRFTPIGRIADVYCPALKIVFEVQCSFITAEEVAARNAAYASLGLEVVWLLHDQQYNRRLLSNVEKYLSTRLHYYTNIDETGQGTIYDQIALYQRGYKRSVLAKRTVNLAQPKPLSALTVEQHKNIPALLHARIQSRPLIFSGEILDQLLFGQNVQLLRERLRAVALKRKQLKWSANNLWEGFKRLYIALFNVLLEKFCD